MFGDNVLIIFVKHPEAGFVKTRLAKAIGKIEAALLYRFFVEAIIRRTETKKLKRIIYYTPARKKKEIMGWLGKNIEIYPQKGGNLGERLSSAFKWTFEEGARRVVVIGTDSPLLGKKVILKAFKELKNNQCVIGPSSDGGYYLLGLSSFYKEIFEGVEWGTDKVFKQTLNTINRLNLKCSLLDEHFDIDNAEDLILLKDTLRKMGKINRRGLDSLIEFVDKI